MISSIFRSDAVSSRNAYTYGRVALSALPAP